MSDLAEFVKKLDEPNLRTLLKARALQIAFEGKDADSLKGMEMFLSMSGGQSANRPLKDIPTDYLLEILPIVRKRLIATARTLAGANSGT